MGILNSKKLEEIKKTIRSHTKEQLLEFVGWYNQEIALAELEEDSLQPAVIKPRTTAKLNGAQQSTAKSKGSTIKKPRSTKVRAQNSEKVVSH